MKWIISHQSALEFWRSASASNALAEKRLHTAVLPNELLDTNQLKGENYWGLPLPVHVLVGSDNARKASRSLRCHISSGKFPAGSFIQTPSGFIVSSPELCFLQMAGELALTDLVLLGYEFCGGYRLDGKNASGRGFRDDQPLTSVAGLASYTAKAAGLKGRKNALRALRHIANGSASPMETVLTMMLTLPYRLGGYGLSLPRLNCLIDTTANTGKSAGKSAGKAAGKSTGKAAGKSTGKSASNVKYYGDLYWPEKQVDVEYDSDVYHTGSDRIAKDAVRRNALTGAGVKVVTVSRMQITDTARLREFAEILAGLLGKRLQYPKKEFDHLHKKLRLQILPRVNHK